MIRRFLSRFSSPAATGSRLGSPGVCFIPEARPFLLGNPFDTAEAREALLLRR